LGQTRRLRTNDGVYFTNAGARKLAHYVEREIERWMSARAPVAKSIPQEATVEPSARTGPSGLHARPLAGPTIPLYAETGSASDELLGGNAPQPAVDALATKVLARGEAVRAPAGRADDYTRRSSASGAADISAQLPMAIRDVPIVRLPTFSGGTNERQGRDF
jgi:uncharacterized protein